MPVPLCVSLGGGILLAFVGHVCGETTSDEAKKVDGTKDNTTIDWPCQINE